MIKDQLQSMHKESGKKSKGLMLFNLLSVLPMATGIAKITSEQKVQI